MGWLVSILLVLLFLVIVLVNVPQVQNMLKDVGVKYLNKKLQTTVRLHHLAIHFPSSVSLDSLYMEDQTGDTLLYSGHLYVGIDMLGLISGKVHIDSIRLDDFSAHIRRDLPDTAFNFDYIIKAFGAGEPDTTTDTSGSGSFFIGHIDLSRIRVRYADVVTGYQGEAAIGQFITRFNTFDLDSMDFALDSIQLDGVFARFVHRQPLDRRPPPEEVAPAEPASALPTLSFAGLRLTRLNVQYEDQPEDMQAHVKLDTFVVLPQRIDLQNQDIRLARLELTHSDVVFQMNSKADSAASAGLPASTSDERTDTSASGPSWRIALDTLRLTRNHIRFDDKGKPKQKEGIDYFHLNVADLQLIASDLRYTDDSAHVFLKNLALKEQSGFDLQQLTTDAVYTAHGARLTQLELRTPNSHLSRTLGIRYPSLATLSDSIGEMGLDVDIDSGRISMKDVAYFQPDLAENEYLAGLAGQPLELRTRISGKLSDLLIDTLWLKAAHQTVLAINGHIVQMLDPDKTHMEVNLQRLSTSRQDLQALLPDSLLPASIRIPDRFSLKGLYKGSFDSFGTQLQFTSTDGDGRIRARVRQLSDSIRASYVADAVFNRIRLDRLLRNDTLYGPASVRLQVDGQGLTTSSMQAKVKGRVSQAVLQGYNYQDLVLDGQFAGQKGNLTARMQDPNLDFSLQSEADLSDSIPAVALQLDLNKADLYALHFSEDSLRLQGHIQADIPQLDLDAPNGRIRLKDWQIAESGRRFQIDSVRLTAQSTDTMNRIWIRSPLLQADMYGNYRLSEAGAWMQYFKNEYMGVDSTVQVSKDTLSDWNMHMQVQLLASTLWQQLLPSLTHFEGAKFRGLVTSKPEGLLFGGSVAPFTFGGIRSDSLRLGIYTRQGKLHYALAGHRIENSAISIPHIYLRGDLDSNAVGINMKIKDLEKKDRYHLAGQLQIQDDHYQFSLLHDSLMLNYAYWNVPQDNYIRYSPEGLGIHHLQLQNGSQSLTIHTDSGAIGSPLDVAFKQFKITTLTQMALKDSLGIEGMINGHAIIDSVMTNPLFVTDLSLDSLSLNQQPVGSLQLKVDNKQKETYAVNLQLTGNGNDLQAQGAYYTTDTGHFDFDVALNALPMTTVEAFSFGQLQQAEGQLTGHLQVKGTTDAPSINGQLTFKDAVMKITELNNYVKLQNESIHFDPTGIHFDQFTVLDSANNKAVLDGDVLTSRYEHFKFNLSLHAKNYRILNAPKKPGAAYYGQVYISTDARIQGDEQLPKVDMNVSLEKNSKVSVALLEENPEAVSSGGVVEFIDRDAPVDSTQIATVDDSTRYSSTLTGIDLSANIAIDTNALLNLIIDPANGDNLSVKGQSNLNFTIDPGGKMSLTGRYEILSGEYNLSFQGVIKRKFDILRGSYITWKGDPTAADMDITARYTVEASALDLVQDQLTDVSDATRNTYKQQLPFYVLLNMKGELMQPDIHFELDMPEEGRQAFGGAVYTRIKQINTEPSEVNKQTLGLLVLGHFIAENPFETANGGGAEQMVRESASKILSQQLNRLAGSLIKGVDINFDLESSQDYSTGTAQNRTNLNVGLSKSLFNDRTTVYVGGNIPLEGGNQQKASQIVGDVAVEYKLSRDGRYRLRAYRKNEYQGVIEGEFIETGLSFIIVMDYDQFKELFKKASELSEQ